MTLIGKYDRQVLDQGTGTVTTAGTPVQIKTSAYPCKYVRIRASYNIGGTMTVGDSNVDGTTDPPKGEFTIFPSQFGEVQVQDASWVYIDASADNSNFSYTILG